MDLGGTNFIIKPTAISNALRCQQTGALENNSPLNYSKGNHKTNQVKSNKRASNCKVCRDQFKEAKTVYSTHRANSSKCPHHISARLPVDTGVQPVTGGVVQVQAVTNQCSYGKDCKMSHMSPRTCTKCDSNSVHRLCVPSETE